MTCTSSPISRSAQGQWQYLESAALDGVTTCGSGAELITAPDGTSACGKEDRGLFLELGLGLKPDGKKIQTQNGIHKVGVDVVFSAPKWFTALLTTAPPEQRDILLAMWRDHSDRLFTRFESKAELCRVTTTAPSGCERSTRQQGSKTERRTAKLVAFRATHNSARPTDETQNAGHQPDPHLHDHYTIPMGYVDGKWYSVDDYGIKNPHQGLALQIGLESEGDLARMVEDLGYKVQYFEDRTGRIHSKMDKLKDLCDFWSSNERRTKEVARAFELKYGRPPNKDELRKGMLWTRKNKNAGEEIIDWTQALVDARLAGHEIPDLDPGAPVTRLPLAVRKRKLLEALYGAQGLCGQADDACFSMKDLDLAVARCSVGLGLTLEEQDEFRTELIEQLAVVDPTPGREKWTTKANLDDEWSIYRRLEEVANGSYPVLADEQIAQGIAEWEATIDMTLDDEQRAVVFAALKSGLLFIEGFAGTGKTRAMSCAAEILRSHKFADNVIAIACARDTALRTGGKLEADHMDSIESFCMAVMSGRVVPTENTVIFLDEAVMVDNARMARLLRMSGPARIICIGDRKQVQCIAAGGWYEDAVKRYGVKTLTKVWRQENEEDILALFNLRSGKAAATLEYLDQIERVHVSESRAEALGQVVADMIADLETGYSTLDVKGVLDGRNTEVDSGNRLIQDYLHRTGKITGAGYAMWSEESGREWTLFEGDEISFCAGYYKEGRKTTKEARGYPSVKVVNGTRGRVLKIDHENNKMWIQERGKDKPTEIDIAHEAFAQCVTPDYFAHVVRYQGGETRKTRYLPSAGTSLETSYSGNSRCIEEFHVYLDYETHSDEEKTINPVEMIVKRWTKASPKISARTRMSWHRKHMEQKVEAHLDHGPTRPADFAPPVEYKPWLERKKKRRTFEVDGRGGIGLV